MLAETGISLLAQELLTSNDTHGGCMANFSEDKIILRQAAEEALEALETLPCGDSYKTHHAAILLIKALAECRSSELQEPPQQQWVGLKYKEANEIACNFMNLGGDIPDWVSFYSAIEAKLKEKNT
jgi:hypothetical protein